MRLSQARIKELQGLLKQLFGLNLTDEQAQQAGLAIMRFSIAKQLRSKNVDENEPKQTQPSTKANT